MTKQMQTLKKASEVLMRSLGGMAIDAQTDQTMRGINRSLEDHSIDSEGFKIQLVSMVQ